MGFIRVLSLSKECGLGVEGGVVLGFPRRAWERRMAFCFEAPGHGAIYVYHVSGRFFIAGSIHPFLGYDVLHRTILEHYQFDWAAASAVARG